MRSILQNRKRYTGLKYNHLPKQMTMVLFPLQGENTFDYSTENFGLFLLFGKAGGVTYILAA